MNASKPPKDILGGSDGKARCQCGRPRYPRYPLCPKCYYDQKKARLGATSEPHGRESRSQPQPATNRALWRKKPDTSERLTRECLKNLSTAELLELRPPQRMSLPDRHERIRFLERIYGQKFRGKEIRYMKNSQLYAISQQAGYRRS